MSTIATDGRSSQEVVGTTPVARVGVIGLGYWGPNLLRVLTDLDSADVRWLCDLDAERLERFGRRHPSTATTRHVEDVLADPEVDAVVIATPVFTHHDLVARALRAGKHVFVEKPLAPSTEQADGLIELAEAEGLALMCGHTFIYSPPVRAVKAMLDAGDLGDLFFISSNRVNLGLHQRDISVVWDLGPHDFSILLYWLGELPESIQAVGRDSIVPGIHDVAFVTMRFPSGLVANVELSWLAPGKLRRTVIVGSQKMVVYDDGTSEPIRLFDHGVVYRDPETFGEYHLSYRTGDILSPRVESYEPLSRELADFTSAVARGDLLREHAAFAQQVVRMTEAADQSLRSGGREIVLSARRFRRVRSGSSVPQPTVASPAVVGGSRA
ncbi:MAG TPA: Gfo/Idh/MocA family oxidoreductase [Conexibacter sp.]|nr:Gfo/Idh/MocA family oxidoreductase [Conexibacter sp.]